MFTGIVEELGSVRSLDGHRLQVACRTVREDSPLGASVAINGVCLTVVAIDEGGLELRSVRGDDRAHELATPQGGGAREPRTPVSLAARLGGHIVQGHVDGVGQRALR